MRKVNVITVSIFSAVALILDFSVWCAVGSPLYLLRIVSANVSVLPTWIFGLLDLLSFAILGAAIGVALSAKCCCETDKYRGAFYFIIGIVLAYLHHILLFSYLAFFVALLDVAMVLIFLGIATVNFARVSSFSLLLSILGGIWFVYLLMFNCIVFLRI